MWAWARRAGRGEAEPGIAAGGMGHLGERNEPVAQPVGIAMGEGDGPGEVEPVAARGQRFGGASGLAGAPVRRRVEAEGRGRGREQAPVECCDAGDLRVQPGGRRIEQRRRAGPGHVDRSGPGQVAKRPLEPAFGPVLRGAAPGVAGRVQIAYVNPAEALRALDPARRHPLAAAGGRHRELVDFQLPDLAGGEAEPLGGANRKWLAKRRIRRPPVTRVSAAGGNRIAQQSFSGVSVAPPRWWMRKMKLPFSAPVSVR